MLYIPDLQQGLAVDEELSVSLADTLNVLSPEAVIVNIVLYNHHILVHCSKK